MLDRQIRPVLEGRRVPAERVGRQEEAQMRVEHEGHVGFGLQRSARMLSAAGFPVLFLLMGLPCEAQSYTWTRLAAPVMECGSSCWTL